MSSISRPHSAFNRLGSYLSFKLSQSGGKGSTLGEFADFGFIFKQSSQLCHSHSGNSKMHIQNISYSSLSDSSCNNKYFGNDNRMLNGLPSKNIELGRALNYQLPVVLDQRVLDIVPSVNSEFTMITKPKGVVEIHSTVFNLSELRQILMFKSDGKLAYTSFLDNIIKLRTK